MALKAWRSCSTKKRHISGCPLGPKHSTSLKRLPGHQCYAERMEGKLVFLQGAWFFPCALGTGVAIMWALLQLLQVLAWCSCLSCLCMCSPVCSDQVSWACLNSRSFLTNAGQWAVVWVVWILFPLGPLSSLSVSVSGEGWDCASGTVTNWLLRDLEGWMWTGLLQGESQLCIC